MRQLSDVGMPDAQQTLDHRLETDHPDPAGRMTLRIEKGSALGRPVFRLIGRMQSEHLPDLKQYLDEPGSKPTLDLGELTLVDVETVRFLIGCEFAGVQLLHCSPYIRQWMSREQPGRKKDGEDAEDGGCA